MINNKKIQAQIEELEVKIKELKEEVNKEEEEPLIDFSEFIGRYGNALAIKGEQFLLKSGIDGCLYYNNILIDWYNESITYTKTTLGELNQGDVFIKVDYVDNMELSDFNILVGVDTYGDYIVQYLGKTYGLEIIESLYYSNKETEVYKFNRN